MRRVLLVGMIACLLFGVTSVVGQSTGLEEFGMANKFYEEKDYESAIRLYESIMNQNVESASLYFNLGNAYFKQGELGPAILNYMRAKKLAPGDDDILHNLQFARQFSRVKMEGVELNPIRMFFSSIVGPYRFDTLTWITSLIFILLVVALIFRYGVGFSNAFVKASIVTALVLFFMAASVTTFKYRDEHLTRRAVIVAESSPVRTGPNEQSDVELEGAPGLVVEILVESGDYYDVLFENKRRGWIKKSMVTEI